MCEEVRYCPDITHETYKRFTTLLLDCWQREYDKRPYRNFQFKILDFEERMGRPFHDVHDFRILLTFLCNRKLDSVFLLGLKLVPFRPDFVTRFVESLKHVKKITLKNMSLPPLFFELLRDSVMKMNVKELNLSGSMLATEDIKCLQIFLIMSTKLRFLNVGRCHVDQYDFALLADGIYKSVSLRGFNCSRLMGNRLSLDTSKIAHTVCSLIWQNKLECIEMEHCEFLAQDIELMCEYIGNKRSKLRKLNLANNKMGPDGAEYLMKAAVANPALEYLNIGANSIGSIGGLAISQHLSSCLWLRHLNISYNEIGAASMNNILVAIKKPIKLEKLYVYGNGFDKKSGDIVRRLLDSGVVEQKALDIASTFNHVLGHNVVVPCRVIDESLALN